jgi:hypothetical protein
MNKGDNITTGDKSAIQSQLDTMKNQTDHLMDEVVKNIPISDNSSYILGDEMYSTQLSSSSNSSLSDAEKVALTHRLSIVDADKCIETLKKHYNLLDVLVAKTDMDVDLNLDNLHKNSTSDMVKINFYNPLTKEPLNMTLCQDDPVNIKTPINNPNFNLTQYQAFKAEGIDIYNPKDDSFNSVCAIHNDNTTDYDTTIGFRRGNYFQNQSIGCSGNCNYTEIDENAYVNCECKSLSADALTYNEFVNYFFDSLSTWNYQVIFCYWLIPPVNIYLT